MPIKRKVGRPTIYSDKIASEICARMTAGESLRKICASDHLPALSTIMRWYVDGDHSEFQEQYARARRAQAEMYAEQVIEIADSVAEGADVQRDRLRVDTRKWVACKLLPKVYGDKVDVTSGGEILRGIAMVPATMSPEEWEDAEE